MQRLGLGRTSAVWSAAGLAWLLGLISVLSLNRWSAWHPLAFVPALAPKTFFEVMDYVSSNIMLPVGALLTSILVGWRLCAAFAVDELAETTRGARLACVWLLRYACPLAILAIFFATLA
jgi:NSS family neurotransmitter:Na+ symporter